MTASSRQSLAQLHLVAAAADAYAEANRGIYSGSVADLTAWLPNETLLLWGSQDFYFGWTRSLPVDDWGSVRWQVGYSEAMRAGIAYGYDVTAFGTTYYSRIATRGRLDLGRTTHRVPNLQYPLGTRSDR